MTQSILITSNKKKKTFRLNTFYNTPQHEEILVQSYNRIKSSIKNSSCTNLMKRSNQLLSKFLLQILPHYDFSWDFFFLKSNTRCVVLRSFIKYNIFLIRVMVWRNREIGKKNFFSSMVKRNLKWMFIASRNRRIKFSKNLYDFDGNKKKIVYGHIYTFLIRNIV